MDGSQSPLKKAKGKFPDIERALANWAKNEQRHGRLLTDDKISEQAARFATTVGSNESQSNLSSSVWLEKFKQKNNLSGTRLKKGNGSAAGRPSDRVLVVDSSTTSYYSSPIGDSESGSSELETPPISPENDLEPRAGVKQEDFESLFDVSHDFLQGPGQRHTTPSAGAFSGDSVSCSSAAVVSPVSPQTTVTGRVLVPIQPADNPRRPPPAPTYSRQRSQTFPNLHTENGTSVKQEFSDQVLPHLPDRSLIGSIFESEFEEGPTAIDPWQTIKRNKSVSDIMNVNRSTSMQPPPLPKSATASPDPAAPTSPSQDDAKRALDLVVSFFQQQASLDAEEWRTVGKLMEKVKIAASSPNDTPSSSGGLYPVGSAASPSLSKKRPISGLFAHESYKKIELS